MKPRLYDMIVSESPTWNGVEMPIIVADEVMRHIDETYVGKNNKSPEAESYGCVAPPFEMFFIEGRTFHKGIELMRGVAVKVMEEIVPKYCEEPAEKIHWQILVSGYVWMSGWEHVRGYRGMAMLHFDHDGYLLDHMDRIKVFMDERLPVEGDYLPISQLATHIVYAMKTISLMHQRVECEHVKPTRQQRRKMERQQGITPTPYYLLKVSPQSKRYQSSGSKPSQPRNRKHHVRGHFRYYTEERPLFGRVSGMIWVPAHDRGSGKLGQIDKGYLVG